MGNGYSLPSFTFPEITENELRNLVASFTRSDLKYERILGKGRVSWSLLVRKMVQNAPIQAQPLYLMRLYAKNTSLDTTLKRVSTMTSVKLNFIHELYYEKCGNFDFVLKPIVMKEIEDFVVLIRPFGRFNLTDRILTESLSDFDKYRIALQLLEHFQKLHALRAFHGDFSSGKVILSSEHHLVFLTDFAPVKPFCRKELQSPIEFYQLWFDEGLDGDSRSVGRGCYLAPERLDSKSQSESLEAADLFSLGCVLAEVFGQNGESFLTFQDVLLLSTASVEEYDNIFASFLERMNFDYSSMFTTSILPIIQNLCKRLPGKRKISSDNLEILKRNIDQKQSKWNELFNSLKRSKERYHNSKRALKLLQEETRCANVKDINFNPETILHNFSSFLLFALTNSHDKLLNVILSETLLKMAVKIKNKLPHEFFIYLLKVIQIKDSRLLKMFLSDLKEFDSNDLLINSANQYQLSENRERFFNQIFKEVDLVRVFSVIDELKENLRSEEKIRDILSKLLQIYRARGKDESEFEDRMSYEENSTVYNVEVNESKRFVVSTMKRIAFQLDLNKNRVPIEKMNRSKGKIKVAEIKNSIKTKASKKTQSISVEEGRLKQRMMTKVCWKMENEKGDERIRGILQSKENTSYFLIFSNERLYFWDIEALLLSRNAHTALPFASIRPRSESETIEIETIIFINGNMIGVLFNDGILGIYRIEINCQVELSVSQFTLVESYGPFDAKGVKLIMCSNLLFIIGAKDIIGIDPTEPRKTKFKYKLNDNSGEIFIVIPIEGCLLIETNTGLFLLVDMFYQTGQELARWHLARDSNAPTKSKIIQCHDTIVYKEPSLSEFKIIKKFTFEDGSRLIQMYNFDPLVEDLKGSFMNWLIPTYGGTNDDKSLNLLKLSKPNSNSVNESFIRLNYSSSKTPSLVVIGDELLDCTMVTTAEESYFDTIRLIDFKNFSVKNSSSILFPLASSSEYKPTLKLRNRKGQVPEIIERYDGAESEISRLETNFKYCLGKIWSLDKKYTLLIGVNASELVIFC